MTKIQKIISKLSEPIILDTPIKIKPTPHSNVIMIYELQKSDEDEIMIRVSDGNFYKLEEKDFNFDMVSRSILQRLRYLK